MVVLLALLAATAFALGTVLQQKGTLGGTGTTPEGADAAGGAGGLRFLTQLFARPVWLLGGAVTAVGAVLNALALHWGTLAGVQALTTLSLVIALPFGVLLTDQRITGPVWVGACLLVAGIVLFVVAGSPQPGTSAPSAADWWAAGLVSVALAAIVVRTGRGRRPALRAVIFGMGAGLGFGMASALTKQFTDLVGQGFVAILTGWELWALLVAGVVGLALGQSALRTGVLAPAMAATNAVTLLVSVTLGVTVFGERLHRGGGRLALVVVGLALVLVGVLLLARAPAPRPDERPPDAEQPPSSARTPAPGVP
ncbi:MAG TPA: DMT family transporter [Blastococcus sp.]|nr:DMT family transporter [Blastococcus sp.]